MARVKVEPSYSDDERDGAYIPSRHMHVRKPEENPWDLVSSRGPGENRSPPLSEAGWSDLDSRTPQHSPEESAAGSDEDEEQQSDEDSDEPTLNTPSSLSKGHIRSKDGKTEYTILLVGETGMGKTAFLTFIDNALNARTPSEYELDIHDLSNESGLGSGHSQTNSAKLYKFTSKNGITLRVLDTPGLADTRGAERDDMHKRDIAKSIQRLINSVNAVLIITNGTSPRLGISTNYALTTLSSMFPRTLADNIGILCTNVSSRLGCNFSLSSLPPSLQRAQDFIFNNSTSLEKNYRDINFKSSQERAQAAQEIVTAHEIALDSFGEILDWIDSRQPQPTNDILNLHQQSNEIERKILNTQSQMMQALVKQEILETFKQGVIDADQDMINFTDFEEIVHRDTYEFVPTDVPVTSCHYPGCYTNCHSPCGVASGVWWWVAPQRCYSCWGHTLKFWVYPACNACGHRHRFHRRSTSKWKITMDSRVNVDTKARDNYISAKTRKDRIHELMQEIDRNLRNLSHSVNEDMKELALLAKAYSSLSLSGNYSSQFEEGIKHLRDVAKTMRADNRDREVIRVVEENIDMLEKRLDLLKESARLTEMQIVQVGARPARVTRAIKFARGLTS